MKRLFVMAERLKSMSTPSRDEELTPMPAGKWFDNLKAAFEWADSSNLLGDLFGWQANVYLLTNKSFVRITKVTERMIYEDELYEALEGLRRSYYNAVRPLEKTKLNSIYGKTAGGPYSVVVYDVDGTEIDRTYYHTIADAQEYCRAVNTIEMYTAFVEEEDDQK